MDENLILKRDLTRTLGKLFRIIISVFIFHSSKRLSMQEKEGLIFKVFLLSTKILTTLTTDNVSSTCNIRPWNIFKIPEISLHSRILRILDDSYEVQFEKIKRKEEHQRRGTEIFIQYRLEQSHVER